MNHQAYFQSFLDDLENQTKRNEFLTRQNSELQQTILYLQTQNTDLKQERDLFRHQIESFQINKDEFQRLKDDHIQQQHLISTQMEEIARVKSEIERYRVMIEQIRQTVKNEEIVENSPEIYDVQQNELDNRQPTSVEKPLDIQNDVSNGFRFEGSYYMTDIFHIRKDMHFDHMDRPNDTLIDPRSLWKRELPDYKVMLPKGKRLTSYAEYFADICIEKNGMLPDQIINYWKRIHPVTGDTPVEREQYNNYTKAIREYSTRKIGKLYRLNKDIHGRVNNRIMSAYYTILQEQMKKIKE